MFDLDFTTIFLSIAFGIIGISYFSHGRKHNFYFLISGIGLLVFPYFVSTLPSLLTIGIALVILPFILQRISPL